MSFLMGISILLALLLVKTRASGTRNGLGTACYVLFMFFGYLSGYHGKSTKFITDKQSN